MARAADNVSTFRNGTDTWSDPNAWVPAGVPNDGTSTYDVVFNGHFVPPGVDTLKLDENITIEKFTMTSGFLSGVTTGGPFTLTLNDTLNWSGGIIGGANVVATAGGSISASTTCILESATLENRGTITYTATFASTPDNQLPLRFDANAVLLNRAGATFNIAGDGGISVTSGSARIDNQGLLIKSTGTGVSQIGAGLNDSGTVRVQSGTLEFIGGSSQHSGSLSAASGATLAFDGVHTFAPSASLGGLGTLQFIGNVTFGGALALNPQPSAGAGPLQVTNGQTEFNPTADVSALGMPTANGGRALRLGTLGTTRFDTGHAVALYDLASNNTFTPQSNASITLTGGDDLALTGPAAWTGGTFASPVAGPQAAVAVNAGMAISGGGMGLDHRTLQNHSTITWTGGAIQLKNGAIIENATDGTFDIRSDTFIGWGPVAPNTALPSIANAGLMVKSAGAGETTINDVRLTNTGTLRVESGTLSFFHTGGNGGGQGYADTGVNSGIYQIDQGAMLAVADHMMDASSTVRGAGTMEFRSNNNTVSGVYDMTGRTNVRGVLAFLPGATVNNPGQTFFVDFPSVASFDTGRPVTLHDLILDGILRGSDPITIDGTFSGAGSVEATNVVAPGTISPGNSPGTLSVRGLTMARSTLLKIELAGAGHDLLDASGTLTLGGDLNLSLLDGYVPGAGDHFTIAAAGAPLAGLFDNAAPGARLTTSDGTGSFAVNYGPDSPFGADSVVLSDFRAVPEPVISIPLALAAALLIRSRRND